MSCFYDLPPIACPFSQTFNLKTKGTGCNVAAMSKILYNGSGMIIAGQGASREEITKVDFLTRELLRKERQVKEQSAKIKDVSEQCQQLRVGNF